LGNNIVQNLNIERASIDNIWLILKIDNALKYFPKHNFQEYIDKNIFVDKIVKEVKLKNEKKYYIAKKNDKIGVVNNNLEIIIPFEYEDIKLNSEDTLFTIQSNGKWGIAKIL